MTLLALDPGKRNFAFAFMEKKDDKIHVLATGFLRAVRDLKWEAFPHETYVFLLQVKTLLARYPVEVIIAERYQVRSIKSGTNAELINCMIGMIATLAYEKDIKVILPTASVWKNHMLQKRGTNETTELFKSYKRTVHESDAIGMGVWFFER